jgi:hypothetical protein
VDVFDTCFNRLRAEDIPIVSGTFLPEAKTMLTWPFSYREIVEQGRSPGLQELLDRLRSRLFRSGKESTYFRIIVSRESKQMDMFRHEHERNELKALDLASCP